MNKFQWLVVIIFAVSYTETTEIIRDSYGNYLMLKILILLPIIVLVAHALDKLSDENRKKKDRLLQNNLTDVELESDDIAPGESYIYITTPRGNIVRKRGIKKEINE